MRKWKPAWDLRELSRRTHLTLCLTSRSHLLTFSDQHLLGNILQYWFSILWKSCAGSYQRDAKVWFSSVGQCKVMIAMIRSCMAGSGSQFLSDLLWFQNPGARDWCWWPPPPCWHCCGSLSYDHGAQPTGAFILIIPLSNGRSLLRMSTE